MPDSTSTNPIARYRFPIAVAIAVAMSILVAFVLLWSASDPESADSEPTQETFDDNSTGSGAPDTEEPEPAIDKDEPSEPLIPVEPPAESNEDVPVQFENIP